MIARITVAAAVDRLFDYAVPDALRARLVPGNETKPHLGQQGANFLCCPTVVDMALSWTCEMV